MCGLFSCDSCDYYDTQRCPGCVAGNENLRSKGTEMCRVYDCVTSANLSSCGECARPECDISRTTDFACPLRSSFQGKRWWAGRMSNYLQHRPRKDRPDDNERKISPRTVERLRFYLLALQDMEDNGVSSVASREIAGKVGVNAALVRKDLSYFGDFGTPSYGYSVKYLIQRIREILHLDQTCRIAWVGAQKLAENLDLLIDLGSHNCQVVTVLDTDESRVGARVAGIRVESLSRIGQLTPKLDISAAVIAVPAADAQKVADALLTSGIRAMLNLTSAVLSVPTDVKVRNANVVSEMMALSFYSRQESVEIEN